MKNNHRSEKLDQLLGKKVQISFIDGTVFVGYLQYVDKFCSDFNWSPVGHYRLLRTRKGGVAFRKSHVKNIKEIGG